MSGLALRFLSRARCGLLFGAVVVSLLVSACGAGPPSGDKVSAVAAGYMHTCALTSAGGVECWGANASGQLGNGTTIDSAKPVDVVGLSSGVVAIAAGGYHSCAVMTAGGVKCWGSNDGGQLGDNTYADSATPVDVSGLASGVVGISAGAGWVCALTSAGAVKCWGWAVYGQLGNGTSGNTSGTPVDVVGLAGGVTSISANSLHVCALTKAGQVKCWGSTEEDKATNSRVPVGVSGLGSAASAISAGGLHACAIVSGGAVKCWGTNGEGELGNGSTTDSDKPVEVPALAEGATALAVGSTTDFLPTHSCALTRTGAVECWGPNGDGQLGNGSTTDSSRPVEVSGPSSGIIAITVGGVHTCAITKTQGLKCWGYNSKGQLGNGSFTSSPTPVDVVGL